MTAFTGLTWDHPRGFAALEYSAQLLAHERGGEPLIEWHRQPLAGFEETPISELAERYDVIVLDHPHIGEAVATGALLPISSLFGHEHFADWNDRILSPALMSYVWEGGLYALPLDVATQVSATRGVSARDVPKSWDEVLSFSKERSVALSIAGPHAFLSLLSVVSTLGGSIGGDSLIPDHEGQYAIDILQTLFHRTRQDCRELNPIDLLERIAIVGDLDYIPLVFGYVTYAASTKFAYTVSFGDPPHVGVNGCGPVLGGTGLALTKRCKPSQELLRHLAWLLKDTTQREFIPKHGGQPSARAAWVDPMLNQRHGQFYQATLWSAENALIRPRFNGYIGYQRQAAEIVREALWSIERPVNALERLRNLWRNIPLETRTDVRDKAKL